jgi:hypothetical protein
VYSFRQKHHGGTLQAFPRGIAFWLEMQLLLLRDLLGRLLCGCLLGCFFGCHFPILPFDNFCVVPANNIAVEECIDSRITSVKEKTSWWWKNRQQFFSDADLSFYCVDSDHAIRLPSRLR